MTCRSFAMTLDRLGKGEKEDGNQKRRQITLHSFRRFVRSTISDLGYECHPVMKNELESS